jgi:hypothetical protein
MKRPSAATPHSLAHRFLPFLPVMQARAKCSGRCSGLLSNPSLLAINSPGLYGDRQDRLEFAGSGAGFRKVIRKRTWEFTLADIDATIGHDKRGVPAEVGGRFGSGSLRVPSPWPSLLRPGEPDRCSINFQSSYQLSELILTSTSQAQSPDLDFSEASICESRPAWRNNCHVASPHAKICMHASPRTLNQRIHLALVAHSPRKRSKTRKNDQGALRGLNHNHSRRMALSMLMLFHSANTAARMSRSGIRRREGRPRGHCCRLAHWSGELSLCDAVRRSALSA